MLICGQDRLQEVPQSSDLWMIETGAKAVQAERRPRNLSEGEAAVVHSSPGWGKGSGRTNIKEDSGLLAQVAATVTRGRASSSNGK